MTRLMNQDIMDISVSLHRLDTELQEKTGRTLRGIACHAAGIEERLAKDLIPSVRIGVISMTCGQGLIEGFAEAVESILVHIGFKAFVTQNTDVSGIAEAFENNADILMLADDNRFVALVLKGYQVIDNATATGKGFAAALDLMAGGLKGESVLVIGCGPVGQSAAEALIHFGAKVSVYDINQKRSRALAGRILRFFDVSVIIEESLKHALSNHRFVVEATNSADVICEKGIRSETLISAPGMPFGISRAVYRDREIQDRILHDPLQTGVATMGIMGLKACCQLGIRKRDQAS